MAGVPGFIDDLGWWAVAIFLFGVVFVRTQATYFVGRWVRAGAATLAEEPDKHPRLARWSNKLSGPRMQRADEFTQKWGFVAIPLSFLTIGLQTLVNAAAGYGRMRWDLYTLAMLPGCVLWVGAYFLVGASVVRAWQASPWLFIGATVAVIVVSWLAVRLRRSADSAGRTPQ
ncbi:DedA family protein [Demequina aurantiaca]|uniref:DedA family protein n=1 Tax=Demequina aurantiaca TaxID=676200 RepID=UPI003D355711